MIPSSRQVVLAGLLTAACRGAAPRVELPVPGATPSDTTCTLTAGPAAARDTVTVVLTEPIDPAHAPLPRNDAERLVFAQLYETLIRVDCRGRVLPDIARSWEPGAGDRLTFTLRDDARFWDGAPVTARDVLAAWRSRDSSLAQTVTLLGDRVFSVRPSSPAVERFADPALAVTKPAPGGWPIGTAGRWVTSADARLADALWALPVPGVALPAIRMSIVPGSAARDAIDANMDLLLTSDPAPLEYARTRPEYLDAPLEWDRTYVLLTPPGSDLDLSALRLETLPQAVHVEARPAQSDEGRPWFTDLRRCGARAELGVIASRPRRRAVYEQGDRDAGDLAARLVGLGVVGRGAVVAGLSPAAFESALRTAAEAAYVLRVRRRVANACSAARDLPAWAVGAWITPLLDTRTHALVRRGSPRLTADWDGTLRFAPR